MNISKITRRDRKKLRRDRMIIDSRSVFKIIDEKVKRANKIKKQRKEKEERLVA